MEGGGGGGSLVTIGNYSWQLHAVISLPADKQDSKKMHVKQSELRGALTNITFLAATI